MTRFNRASNSERLSEESHGAFKWRRALETTAHLTFMTQHNRSNNDSSHTQSVSPTAPLKPVITGAADWISIVTQQSNINLDESCSVWASLLCSRRGTGLRDANSASRSGDLIRPRAGKSLNSHRGAEEELEAKANSYSGSLRERACVESTWADSLTEDQRSWVEGQIVNAILKCTKQI